jgi:hypothetical protein
MVAARGGNGHAINLNGLIHLLCGSKSGDTQSEAASFRQFRNQIAYSHDLALRHFVGQGIDVARRDASTSDQGEFFVGPKILLSN